MKKVNSLLLIFCISLIINTGYSQVREAIHYTPKPVQVAGTDIPVLSLNGTWDFNAAPGERFFTKPNGKKLSWKAIQVPGEWVMQGFTVAPGTAAAYRHLVEVPASWKDKSVMIKFDGVYSQTTLYLNGKEVARHEGGFTPFEADLTKMIKPGKSNELILSVRNESTADTLASASQYAAHQLGGITRKVELFAVPKTHIAFLNVSTDLDEHYEDAVLEATIGLSGVIGDSKELKVKILLNNPANGLVLVEKLASAIRNPEGNMIIKLPVEKPDLWDPEHPNLYDLFVSLEENGKTLETVRQKVGFREIAVAGNRVFVNGQPIKLRGVNRHEVHPTRGRSLTMNDWMTDAVLFKEANVNYIRTSHYPPAEEFIAICDSIGLFVECEAPMCWVGHNANDRWKGDDPHSNKFYTIIRQQAMETVAQYRNHPAIIIWSMANESAWGPIWQRVLEEINATDHTRPVSFHDQAYGGYNNYGSKNTQIANIHYPGPGGPDVARKFDRPLLFGEYAHLNTYNRQEIVTDPGVRDAWGRGLENMFENMYYSTGCLGGAIWSGIDDVFYLPEGKAIGYGEWGPLDSWRRKKPEYWHLKKIYSPVKVISRELAVPQPGQPLTLSVENRMLFSNLSEVSIRWRMGASSGSAAMDLDAGRTGILKIWTDRQPTPGETLEVDFVSPQGYVMDQYALTFKGVSVEENKAAKVVKPELSVLERLVRVSYDGITWTFDAPTGKLRNVFAGDQEVISDGPDLFLVPLTTGPCNTEHSLDIEPLNDPCQQWNGKVSATGREGDLVYVEVSGSYEEADLKIRYNFQADGVVKVDYEILPHADSNPRQVGLVFQAPAALQHLSWERTGQWSVYPETHLGRPKGEAIPFPDGMLETENFGAAPGWIWEKDTHPMGSNDFRATRDKLKWAQLTDAKGSGVKMTSDGTGAFRAWVAGDAIGFLAASFSTAGGDMFFSSHLASERQPLKAGETRTGSVLLTILK